MTPKHTKLEFSEPSQPDTMELHQAIKDYIDLQPWKDLDNHVVRLDHPHYGTVFAVALGNSNLAPGLTLYLGEPGINSYANMIRCDHSDPIRVQDIGLNTECISLIMGDRDELGYKELRQIQQLKLRYRGMGNWPLLRRMTRGYHPWHLDATETACMTAALEAVADSARMVRDGRLDPAPWRDFQYFYTRSMRNGTWYDRWTEPPPLTVKTFELTNNRRQLADTDMVLSLRYSNLTTMQRGEIRPRSCAFLLTGDDRTGLVTSLAAVNPPITDDSAMDIILNTLHEMQVLPRTITALDRHLAEDLQPCRASPASRYDTSPTIRWPDAWTASPRDRLPRDRPPPEQPHAQDTATSLKNTHPDTHLGFHSPTPQMPTTNSHAVQ